MSSENDRAIKSMQAVGSLMNGLMAPVMIGLGGDVIIDEANKYNEELKKQEDANKQTQVNAAGSISV